MKAFAPVNIAWVKYMGKERGRPTNSSFSMTLSDAGTETEIRKLSARASLQGSLQAPFSFVFSKSGYIPPDTGQAKAFRFLSESAPFLEVLSSLGFHPRRPEGFFEIWTKNSVPAGTGIATSASGFAALTLAWIPHLLTDVEFARFRALFDSDDSARARIAALASRGSGSACRSFHGPFVEWGRDGLIRPFRDTSLRFVDFILILESGAKEVSSSEAHLRVLSSPLFAGRADRAEQRLLSVKSALASGEGAALCSVVLEEALDMHELFHTSEPPFRYFNQHSEAFLDRIRSGRGLPSGRAALTFDAGANAHLFVPEEEAGLWRVWIAREFPRVEILMNLSGKGAVYR